MNISDIQVDWDEYKDKDLFHIIYDKQNELRELYKVPICDIDVSSDQQQLRAMAWNIVEEGGEVMEVLATTEHQEHIIDELSDMVSFYFELLIMSNLKYDELNFKSWMGEKKGFEEINLNFSEFVSALSISINTLKNRYWRQSHLLTDPRMYKKRLLISIERFMKFVSSLGISSGELFGGYIRKYRVNKFRIESKY